MLKVEEKMDIERLLSRCKKLYVIRNSPETFLCQNDCIEGMNMLPPGSMDVIVTSPPYNLGINYNGYNDRIPREEYLGWTDHWAEAVSRVLSCNGSFFLNVGSKPTDPTVSYEVPGKNA